MGVAAFLFMAYINPTLTLIAVAPDPGARPAHPVSVGQAAPCFKKVQEQFSVLTEFARFHVFHNSPDQGLQTRKTAGGAVQRTGRKPIRSGQSAARRDLWHAVPISGLLGTSACSSVLFFGGRMIIDQTITQGILLPSSRSYLFLMTWPMMGDGGGWPTSSSAA